MEVLKIKPKNTIKKLDFYVPEITIYYYILQIGKCNWCNTSLSLSVSGFSNPIEYFNFISFKFLWMMDPVLICVIYC